jgi:transcriptional regulator with XRE-family HTH domain
MIIGERLRAIREKQGLSQTDVEQRAGIRGTYISRVENGHTVPSVAELEEIAYALGIPLHELFYDSWDPPRNLSHLTESDIAEGHHLEARNTGFVSRLGWLFGNPDVNLLSVIRFFFSRLIPKAKRRRS